MTKNRSMKIAVLVLALALLTSCFVGSTFAKYTSSASGSDSATVAKWSISVEGTEIAVVGDPQTITFDLFNTINEEDTTSEEENVAAEKIAPGTGGSFTLDIVNNSEVDATYTVTFNVTNAGVDHDNNPETPNITVPLEFKVGAGEWKSTLDNVSATDIAMKNAENTDDEASVVVSWRWAYDGNATNDTALGIKTPAVEVSATVNVDQAN